jgi:adenine-specific DNA-methyltransferase
MQAIAGSGTTGHAVLMLNQVDGGNRKFILCTNNENKIAEEVTFPRVKAVIKGYADIKGIPANVRYFKTSFVSKSKVSDDTRNSLVRKSVQMICVRENTFTKVIDKKGYKIYRNENLVTGVLFDLDEVDTFKEQIAELGTLAHIYVFSLTNDTYTSDFQDLNVSHELCPIPESILEVYRKIFKN